MSKPTIHRYEVTFQPAEVASGCSLIALTLTRNGEPLDHDTMFFLEPVEGITPEETARMAAFLNKYTAHFGAAIGAAETEEL